MLSRPRYRIIGEIERFDERDNIQARAHLRQSSPEFVEFYARHPEWEKGDNELRAIDEFVGSPLDHPLFLQEITAVMKAGAEDEVDGLPSPAKTDVSAERATEKIKGFARFLGADLVRTGPLNPAFVYTHIGKTQGDPKRTYGAAISLGHKNAITIAIGLDPLLMKTGPALPMAIEVMKVYNRLASIAKMLAGYIRSLGYPARAHIVSNYQVLCVPVAIDAGLGELGRHGIMLTKELGSSLKLATVTTDLPLVHDSPVDIGAGEFCADCKICAEACPGGAIPFGKKKVVRGVEKWAINSQACFRIWRETGTDCGVCVAACPWTKPRTGIHNLAVSIATGKKKAGWWMSRAEKLFYGKFQPRKSPPCFEEPEPVWRKYKPFR
jgi:reductive dehalogenase